MISALRVGNREQQEKLARILVIKHHLLGQFRQDNPHSGILDLKAYYRGFRYIQEMLKMLPEKPDPILLSQIFAS
jgi:hypothetical protein